MKKYSFFWILALIIGFTACDPDPELDPIQFEKLKQSSMLALRGDAYDNLFDDTYIGSNDKFSLAKPDGESFDFESEFLSPDPTSLSKVDVYAEYKKGTRTLVATVDGSTFKVATKYPRGKISIPLATILSKLNLKLADLAPEDAFTITSDLTLKDGSTILASSIANSSLSEGDHFYPAHKLRYLVEK